MWLWKVDKNCGNGLRLNHKESGSTQYQQTVPANSTTVPSEPAVSTSGQYQRATGTTVRHQAKAANRERERVGWGGVRRRERESERARETKGASEREREC
eukprot:2043387-Rhodomonas_salina.1